MVMSIDFRNRLFGSRPNPDDNSEESEISKATKKLLARQEKVLDNTIKNLSGVIEKTTDKEIKKAAIALKKKVESQSEVRQRLVDPNRTISNKEAKKLQDTVKELEDTIESDIALKKELLKQEREGLASTKITEEFKKLSKKLGESTEDFFVSNAKEISQSGITRDLGTTGVRAIAPEIALVTESLGINLQDQANRAFGGISDFFKKEDTNGFNDSDEQDELASLLGENTEAVTENTEAVANTESELVSQNTEAVANTEVSLGDLEKALSGNEELKFIKETLLSIDKNIINNVSLSENTNKLLSEINSKIKDISIRTPVEAFQERTIDRTLYPENADIEGGIQFESDVVLANDEIDEFLNQPNEAGPFPFQEDVDNESDIIDALLNMDDEADESTEAQLDAIMNLANQGHEDAAIIAMEVKSGFANQEQTELTPLVDVSESIATAINMQTEAIIESSQDNTAVLAEQIDDIEDAQRSGNGFFSKFLGKGLGKLLGKGGFLGSAILGLSKLLSPMGKFFGKSLGTLGKAGKLAKGGLAIVGGLLGLDALRDIQGEEGLTAANLAQSALGGAAIGAMFGPMGALIGAGVGGVAGILASFVTDDHLKQIEDALDSTKEKLIMAGESIEVGFQSVGSKLGEFIFDIQEALTPSEETKAKFKSVLNDNLDFFKELISKPIDTIDNIITAVVDGLIDIVSDQLDKIKDFVDIDETTIEVQDAIGGTIESIGINIGESFKGFKEAVGLSTIEEAKMETGANIIETSQGIENDISQSAVAASIQTATTMQIQSQKETMKETKEIIKEVDKGKQQGFVMQRSLDNTPIATNDLGLLIVLGGGG